MYQRGIKKKNHLFGHFSPLIFGWYTDDNVKFHFILGGKNQYNNSPWFSSEYQHSFAGTICHLRVLYKCICSFFLSMCLYLFLLNSTPLLRHSQLVHEQNQRAKVRFADPSSFVILPSSTNSPQVSAAAVSRCVPIFRPTLSLKCCSSPFFFFPQPHCWDYLNTRTPPNSTKISSSVFTSLGSQLIPAPLCYKQRDWRGEKFKRKWNTIGLIYLPLSPVKTYLSVWKERRDLPLGLESVIAIR